MTKLFDTALPPIWYVLFWLLLVLFTRWLIVNPLVAVGRDLIAALKGLR